MNTLRFSTRLGIAVFALGLTGLTGCQTWFGGMTLPSAYYMEHQPRYFRPDPDFPLQKELATMQGEDALINAGGRALEIQAQPGK